MLADNLRKSQGYSLVGDDPIDPTIKVLAHAKHNLAPKQKSLIYKVEYVPEAGATRLKWEGTSELISDDLVEFYSKKDRETKENTKTRTEGTTEFLKNALADGARPVEAVKPEAKTLGFSWMTIRQCIKPLGIKTYYPGVTGSKKHEWALPRDPPSPLPE